MGISRDKEHKRRSTGGRRVSLHMKRKFEMGRQPAMTKLAPKRIRQMRGRGGNLKQRALRLDHGTFSWGTEVASRKTRILDVVYNASSNELIRTKTLVKNAIVQIDATPFRAWYEQHYGVRLGKNKGNDDKAASQSNHVKRKIATRQATRTLDSALADQFNSGRLLAAISSRPGQSGRADGYILEGPELAFYARKLKSKKK